MHSEGDYSRLTTFMEAATADSDKLKQLFINAGIVSIQYIDDMGNTKQFSFGNISQSMLRHDRLYNLYVINRYDKIKLLLEDNPEILEPNERVFYLSIVSGYSDDLDTYGKMDTSQLSTEQNIA